MSSFELRRGDHIEGQLVKIVRRELRRATRSLTGRGGIAFTDAVHEARKRIKKVRAVAEFLMEAGTKLPRKDRKRLKAAAHDLSILRDTDATIETLERVRRRYPKQLPEHTYRLLCHALADARDRAQERAHNDGVIDEAVKSLRKVRKSSKQWPDPALELSSIDVVVSGSYGQSRKAMRHARATQQSASFHQWRKEVKTLWYQLRLAKPLTTGLAPIIADLERLESTLGDDHNLVVLAATLRGCHDLETMRNEVRHISRLATRMRQQLRRRAFTEGRPLYLQTRKAFGRWIRHAIKPSIGRQAVAA